MKLRNTLLVVALAALAGTRGADAAPIPFTTDLPLTAEDVRAFGEHLPSPELIEALDFLATLRVFEDDTSTAERPIYYLAPFFSADASQEVIGGQQIATDLLAYLDRIDALLAAIQGSHRRHDRLEAVLADTVALADRLRASGQIPADALDPLLAYARQNPYARELELEPRRIAEAFDQLHPGRRRLIIAQILQALDRLQVPITAEERQLAQSDPARFVITVLPRLRAKLSTMLFGIRHATFVSGLTAKQKRYLMIYRRLRPDVQLRALPIRVLRVLPAAATIDGGGLVGDGVSAPEMLRGVNAETGGVCGLTSACTVIVEYTEIGARSALLSTRGASIMPALFVGDVVVAAPVERGGSCDTAALRQRAPVPVSLGLIGERQMLRVVSAPGVCRGGRGDLGRLASALLLSQGYRQLLFEPSILSMARRRQLAAELQRMVARDDSVVRHLGLVGTVVRQLGHVRDDLLWRIARASYGGLLPRFPPELLAGIVVASTGDPRETAQFDFDGIAIACWKRGADGQDYLSACPDEAPAGSGVADIQGAIAAGLETRDCAGAADLTACAAAIQAPAPDERGYLWTGL